MIAALILAAAFSLQGEIDAVAEKGGGKVVVPAHVKYRGIFVNDEDWGLRPWAVRHFGKKEQIGTNVYTEVFALMKKNGLNLIWPAMHEGGYEFSSRPENLELAKKNGITIGTSHCEPMLRNNCYLSKADKKKWSWVNNREFLIGYWKEGVDRYLAAKNVEGAKNTGGELEVLWTIGMRGIHDGRMPDGKTTEEKRKILEEVFAAQCAMLPEGAPKMFCPYKEVLPIFNSGLKVPEDAIIMWTNDNFGYVRRVGGDHGIHGTHGRQGIYWHLSYHGHPHGYIHLCTTPPAFMWYELVAKCWENGVRDVWMVNAGDVFQAEILLDAFGRFAADPEAWKAKTNPQREAIESWVSEEFLSHKERKEHKVGECLCELCVLCGKISSHLAEYYNLGFNRKPEHMCVQWTTNLPASLKSSLLNRYHALLAEDLAIEEMFTNANVAVATGSLGVSEKAALTQNLIDSKTPSSESNIPKSTRVKENYFRLIGFQVRFLAYSGIIHLEGRDKDYSRSVIDPLYERWNKLDGGKWSGFWCDTIDENGGMRQPTTANRWSSQMQWPWNEPVDPSKPDRKGVRRSDYVATAYRADVPEPVWLEPIANTPANGGSWTRVEGLGTSGRALALLPVKPGVGEGAVVKYVAKKGTIVLQFLPDFALWPGLGLSVDVRVNGGEVVNVKVPGNNANLGEHDKVRNAAVQDNFVRAVVEGVALKDGENVVEIIARDPGVVIDKVGVLPLAR